MPKLRNRFFAQDVWETMGVDPEAIIPHMEHHAEGNEVVQNLRFSKVAPNCRELGIVQFEDLTDTTEEYDSLDAVAGDAAG